VCAISANGDARCFDLAACIDESASQLSRRMSPSSPRHTCAGDAGNSRDLAVASFSQLHSRVMLPLPKFLLYCRRCFVSLYVSRASYSSFQSYD